MMTFNYKNFVVMIERGRETITAKALDLDSDKAIKRHFSGYTLPQIKKAIKAEIDSQH